MWTIARARAAGVLFALAVLLVPSWAASGVPGVPAPGVPGSSGSRPDRTVAAQAAMQAAARHLAAGHRPDASGPADNGQLALVHHAPVPALTPERRGSRGGGQGLDLAAAIAAALAAAVLLAVPTGRRAWRCRGRRSGPPRSSRAPPRLLSA
jgi:hypothetical protein